MADYGEGSTLMRIDIKILGPLVATVDGVSIVPTAPKQRQVLAILALNAGRLVTVAQIVEEMWDQDPPRIPVASLQTYILHIRRKIERALANPPPGSSRAVLVTAASGYVLEGSLVNIDATRYEQLAADGREAMNRGDDATASRTLAAALDVWRGPALVDLPVGPHLQIEATKLEESRLSVLDLRIDADLRLGRHHQLLEELAGLCARYPWLESFHAQYMLALYRSGRQSRSLELYRRLQANVAEHLGVDPTRRLRQLHQAILAGDPIMDDTRFVVSDWTLAPAR
jgi:SARP family transcriptional regulator, regulator of embCAB operon